jgi:carbonic anhydrase/acetyltransferase-like protein (isoleucine patch superfamily)
MATFPTKGLFRRLEGGAAIADNARITGEVEIGQDSTIWFGVVIRGDDALVSIGRRTNVQDLSMIHADPGVPNVIGNEVTIGHGCVLHGIRVGDRSLIGMGAILLAGSVVGEDCIVGAGAVVKGIWSPECPLGSFVRSPTRSVSICAMPPRATFKRSLSTCSRRRGEVAISLLVRF